MKESCACRETKEAYFKNLYVDGSSNMICFLAVVIKKDSIFLDVAQWSISNINRSKSIMKAGS
jgi:hypothetical protein